MKSWIYQLCSDGMFFLAGLLMPLNIDVSIKGTISGLLIYCGLHLMDIYEEKSKEEI